MHMSHDLRQPPLKTLLNTLGTYHKIHTTTTRYGNHDTEDAPAPNESASLDLVPPDHIMLRHDSDSSDEYSEETDTHHPLAELLEQFWQLQDQLAYLKSATHLPINTAELTQSADKLQHFTMMLQPHPTPHLKENPTHMTVHAYMDTVYATDREANLTMSLFQDISTFDRQDSSKLKDWLMDLETTT